MSIEVVNEAELRNEIEPIKDYAVTLVIKSDMQNQQAAEYLKTIKAKQKIVEEFFGPLVKSSHDAWKQAVAKRKEIETPLEDAERKIKSAILRFQQDMEMERRRLQAEADAKARAEEDKKRKELESRAQKAEEKGKEEKADELRAKAESVVVVPQIIAPQVTKTKGVSMMDVWKYKINDINAVPREYMMLNESMVSKVVKATKGGIKIPGIEAYNEPTISGRAF